MSKKQSKFPIIIISKGRADICKTHLLLEYSGLSYFYAVEPQDYDAYVERFGAEKVLNIGENDKGIYFVRNFCIEWSLQKGYTHHWQTDDDLTGQSEIKPSKIWKSFTQVPLIAKK